MSVRYLRFEAAKTDTQRRATGEDRPSGAWGAAGEMPMPSDMTTLPAWASADWASEVAEPFRSDRDFWRSVAASADALITVVAAAVVAVALALAHETGWALLPFAFPAALMVRAGLVSRGSSRRNQGAFADRRTWRDAERAAVAAVFFKVLRRHRGAAH
jgi:hypothetical protein